MSWAPVIALLILIIGLADIVHEASKQQHR